MIREHRAYHPAHMVDPDTRERLARLEEATRYQADRLNAHHDRITSLDARLLQVAQVVSRNKAAIATLLERLSPMLEFERSLHYFRISYKAAIKILAAVALFILAASGRLTHDVAKDWRDFIFSPTSQSRR